MKHVTLFAFVALFGLLALASPAQAQVAAGLNEVSGRGSFESGKYIDNERATALEVNMFYGRFLTDRIQVGPVFGLNKYEGERATGAFGAFVDYHFGETAGPVVPYLEVGATQFITGNDDYAERQLFVGPGLKWFVGEGGGAFIANAQYRRSFVDNNGVDSGANGFLLGVGVSIFFGR